MFYLIGVLVSTICVGLSILELKQDVSNYFDFVGFLVVLGGTSSLLIMTFPWHLKAEIKIGIKNLFTGKKVDMKLFNQVCYSFVQKCQGGVPPSTAHTQKIYAEQVLNDGAELIQLGFSKDKIEQILDERIFQWNERMSKVSGAFRSLAKYPPAFGLVGTVLGLVSLMRAISQGTSSTEAGVRMAVALVATLYGLITANLIVNPAGERIGVLTAEEKKAADLAMRAVLLAAESVTLLEAQEVLNSFVRPQERVNVLSAPEDDFEADEEEATGAVA